MGTPPPLLLGLCAALLLTGSCTAQTLTAAVVGATECSDCAQKSNIQNENPFKGLRVAVKCKLSDGKYETKAVGPVDDKGNFNVKLPSELLQESGELKHECLAELHSAPNAPCPNKDGLSKLILKSKDNGLHTFAVSTAGKLSFSSATCVSATFLPPFKDPWHKSYPKYHMPPITIPPVPDFHHHDHHYDHHDDHHYDHHYDHHDDHHYDHHDDHHPIDHHYDHHYDHHDDHHYDHHDDHHPIYTPPTYTHPVHSPPTYTPPSGGYYNPPAPVYTHPKPPPYSPPTGGYYHHPSAPVYKPTPVPHYQHPLLEHHDHPHPKIHFPPLDKKPLPHWHKYSKPGHPGYPPVEVHPEP